MSRFRRKLGFGHQMLFATALNHRYYVAKDDVLSGDWYVPPLTRL